MYYFFYTIQNYFGCQFFAYKASIGFFLNSTIQFIPAVTRKCLLSNPFLYAFHLIRRYHHYLLFFLHHLLYISLFESTIFTRFILEKFRDFLFLFSSHYILLTHYLLKKICHDQIKTLEIEVSIVSNLDFPSNTILSCIFLLFLIIDLYFFNFCTDCINFQSYCRTCNCYRNTN